MQESISFTQIREIKRELNHINKTKKERKKKTEKKKVNMNHNSQPFAIEINPRKASLLENYSDYPVGRLST